MALGAQLGEVPSAAARLKNRRILAGMVASLDENVGRILEAIDEAGIRDDTPVWFFSDNGGIGDNRPLRGSKATVYEGGIRVAAAVRWPGRIPAGLSDIEGMFYEAALELRKSVGSWQEWLEEMQTHRERARSASGPADRTRSLDPHRQPAQLTDAGAPASPLRQPGLG